MESRSAGPPQLTQETAVIQLSLIALALVATLGLSPAHADAQTRQLFNGKDLAGWAHVGKGRVYVDDGLLKTEGGMGLLWYTREKFGDAVLRVVYRTTTVDDNSGIFIRIPRPPQDPWQAVHSGYEVQILENFPEHYARSDHQKEFGMSWHTTGAIYSISPAIAKPQKPVGEWNTMEIELRGPRTVIRLNGVLVNDFTEGSPVPERQHAYEPIRGPRPDYGFIGIQNHHEPQTVHFKEISVTPLAKGSTAPRRRPDAAPGT